MRIERGLIWFCLGLSLIGFFAWVERDFCTASVWLLAFVGVSLMLKVTK